MGDTLKITEHEAVVIQESDGDQLVVEAVWAPGGSPPPPHFHPGQDEHFEVLEGELRVKRGPRQDLTLRPGDQLKIQAGTVHRMWNESSEPARARWVTSPAGRTEDWFRSIDRLHRQAGSASAGLAMLALVDEYDDVFRLAIAPQRLLQAALRIVAPLGRRRLTPAK